MKRFALSATLVICGLLAVQAGASPMVYETFDLPPFQSYLQGQPAGLGLVGQWQVEQGETHPTLGDGWRQRRLRNPLGYGDVEPVGYAASAGDRAFHPWEHRVAARATLASPVASDGNSTIWMGFLYRHDQRYVGSSGEAMVVLEDSGNPDIRAGVYINRVMIPSRHAVVGATAGSANSVQSPFVGYEYGVPADPANRVPDAPDWVLGDGRVFFILARVDLTSTGALSFVNVYTDGQLPSEEPQEWQAWTWSQDLAGGQLDTLLLGGANANCFYDVDEIRVGTTMQDVLVPEPASLGLLGLGGLLLRRRR